MVDLTRGHSLVAGRTGSGKTYLSRLLISQWSGPVFSFDTQEEGLPGVEVSRSNSLREVVEALKAGDHLVYVPPVGDDAARAVAAALCRAVIGRDWTRLGDGLLLVFDEAAVYFPQDKPPREEILAIARRGRKWGIKILAITQRPADVSKGLVTQCVQHIVFQTSWEGPYFRNYGVPSDQVAAKLQEGGDYSFVVWDGASLTGPFKAP